MSGRWVERVEVKTEWIPDSCNRCGFPVVEVWGNGADGYMHDWHTDYPKNCPLDIRPPKLQENRGT